MPVDRGQTRSDALAGEENLGEFGSVGADQGDAVSSLEPGGPDGAGDLVASLVELREVAIAAA